ncbi:MAG: alpha-L-fucosidase [Bacteroidetes bacterium]|nr:alpha-L-fucosidase [Bacteroidota bacterium]
MRNSFFYTLPVLILVLLLQNSCERPSTPIEDKALTRKGPSAASVKNWRDQKFSMFIHFGLYAVPAGIWSKEKVTIGYSEQIRAHGKIPKEDYAKLTKQFNPTLWNPDSVARLAKKAGMGSIVITSKHHDGFAMFHTKQSDFNIVDATPYKKDLLAGLAEACKKEGLRFGVYFSLIDWNFPEALPISDHNSDSIPPAHHQFNLKQVEELMTGYGPISEIWFDMGKPTAEQSRELANLVRKLQPECLISGRLWHDEGDFAVMGDNASPDFRMGTLWQTPASMFDETWGYRSWQVRNSVEEKTAEKIKQLIHTVGNGGNYLLNVGPTGKGEIIPFEQEVLKRMGAWLALNGEAVYGAEPVYLENPNWGYATEKDNKLYFLITQPAVEKIAATGILGKIKSVNTLEGADLKFNQKNETISLETKDRKPFKQYGVVRISFDNKPSFKPEGIINENKSGQFELTYANGTRYHSYSGKDYYTTKPVLVKLEWNLQSKAERSLKALIEFNKDDLGKSIHLFVNEQIFELNLQGGGDQQLNQIELTGPIVLSKGLNKVQIELKDQNNPHKELGLNGLVIRLIE